MEKKFKNDNYFSNGWKSDEWSSDGWSSDGWFSDEKADLSLDDLEGIAGGFAPPVKQSPATGGCVENPPKDDEEKKPVNFEGIVKAMI